jgi:hypothetical protein
MVNVPYSLYTDYNFLRRLTSKSTPRTANAVGSLLALAAEMLAYRGLM